MRQLKHKLDVISSMKKIILLVLTMFALTAFADEPVSTISTVKTVTTVSKMLTKKSKRQIKALSSVQQSKFVIDDNDDYGPPDSEDLDIHRAYSRPKLVTLTTDDVAISAKVLAKLKLARELAMSRYQEKWCNGGVV